MEAQENGIVTYDLEGIEAAVAMLVPRLSKMALKYPGTTMTLLANLLVIMSAHFGESCLAWDALPVGHIYDQQTARQLRGTV